MDAFYASVEQRDFPCYRNKPIAVGGPARRGVIAAASYAARKFGVHSAMPTQLALKKCPGLVVIPPRFEVYRSISRQLRNIFMEYTDLVEPLSLDEAYLDVTHNKQGLPSATLIAREIKTRIKKETRLTASAGVSMNKFLAKVASDLDKPDGLTVITPQQASEFIKALPIEKFYGVGKVTAGKMRSLGIQNGADLLALSLDELVKCFGKVGLFYYRIARGVDERPVQPTRQRKSIGAERTFEQDIREAAALRERLAKVIQLLWPRVKKVDAKGKTITLKVKYDNFVIRSRSRSLKYPIASKTEVQAIAEDLLFKSNLPSEPIRLLGVTISNLAAASDRKEGLQLTLNF